MYGPQPGYRPDQDKTHNPGICPDRESNWPLFFSLCRTIPNPLSHSQQIESGLIFIIYLFIVHWWEREREETSVVCLLYTLKARIKPTSFWCTGWCSSQLSYPVRSTWGFLKTTDAGLLFWCHWYEMWLGHWRFEVFCVILMHSKVWEPIIQAVTTNQPS